MKYRKLSNTGTYVSTIAYGTMFHGGAQWQATPDYIKKEDSLACLKKAVDVGINYIDCADLYGAYGNAEAIIGEFIKDYERSDFVISSKTFLPMSPKANDRGLSRKHIFESVDKSIHRLGTDYIDLYYAHRYDYATPLEETVKAMNDLIDAGKIHYWATSNWGGAELERAFGIAKKLGIQGPVVDQAKYSMVQRYSAEVELPYTCEYHGFGIVPYKTVCDAILTPYYFEKTIKDLDENDMWSLSRFGNGATLEEKVQDALAKVEKLKNLAQELDISISQLALSWVLENEYVSSAIMSSGKVNRIEENAKAMEIKLNKDTLEKIKEILNNDPSPDKSYKYVTFWYQNALVKSSKESEGIYPPSPQNF